MTATMPRLLTLHAHARRPIHALTPVGPQRSIHAQLQICERRPPILAAKKRPGKHLLARSVRALARVSNVPLNTYLGTVSGHLFFCYGCGCALSALGLAKFTSFAERGNKSCITCTLDCYWLPHSNYLAALQQLSGFDWITND